MISWRAGGAPSLAARRVSLQTNAATMLDPYGGRVALALPATVFMPDYTRGL